MSSDSVYCADTSSLVQMQRFYPLSVFPGLWDNASALAKNGRLVGPEEVLLELERGDDDLVRWAKKHRRIFKRLTQDVVLKAQEIVRAFPRLVDAQRVSDVQADPFVVAMAVVERDRPSLLPREWIVLAEESGRQGLVRIRTVCQHFEIHCVSLKELFVAEGWRFS